MREPVDLTLAQAARAVRERRLSPVELVQASLARIQAQDGVLKSFITVFEEQALQVAKAAEAMIDAGHLLGPLHGVPIALKGVPSENGI